MENKEASETLEKGFVELRKCQTGDGLLKDANSVLPCNLDHKCASDAYNVLSEVKHVEFGGDLDNGRVEESVVDHGICGNDQMGKVEEFDDMWHSKDSEFDVGGVQMGKVEEIIGRNADTWHSEDLTFNMGDRIQLGKVDELEGKDDNACHSHEPVQDEEGEDQDKKSDDVLHQEPGLLPKLEDSGNGINLFVEVFGPLDGISESNNCPSDKHEHVFGDGDSTNECSSKEKGTLSSSFESASAKNEVEGIAVGEQERKFNIGDLVWAKTRSHLWWPGIISVCSNAASDKKKSKTEGNFHVKYLGNANSVWCNDSEMKPFAEYFDQMSGQNKSRNFSGSVEKALSEYGLRMKLKMTCLCFAKEGETHAIQLSLEKHKSDALLLSQFEPASFSACIQQLARSALAPGKIDLIAIKNSLSAFYCSTGHCQLPLQQLRSGGDAAQNAHDGLKPEVMDKSHNNISGRSSKSAKERDDDDHHVLRSGKRNRIDDTGQAPDDKASLSIKGPESRERKKSKYLSYPYVNVNKGLNAKSTVEEETEDVAHRSSVTTKSTPRARSGGKTSQKRGLRKPSNESVVVGGAANIDTSPSDLLTELRNTACDCFYIRGSKYSDSLKGFCCGFRKFAFLDSGEACKGVGCQQEPDDGKCLPQKSSEAVVPTEGTKVVKASEKQKTKHASVKETAVDNQASEANRPQKKHGKCNRAKKKKEQVTSAGLQSTEGEVMTQGVKLVKASKKKRVNLTSLKKTVDNAVDNQLSEASGPQMKGNHKCRRPKKRKEPVKSDGRQPTEAESLTGGVEAAEASGKLSEDHASLKETDDKAEDNQIPEENGPQAKGNGKRRPAKKKKEQVTSSGLQSAEPEVLMEGVEVAKASEKQIVDDVSHKETVDNAVENQIPEANGLQAKGNAKRKAGKKKKEQVMSAGTQSTNNCVDTSSENNLNSSHVIDFQKPCPDVPQSLMGCEKREGSNPVLRQINTVAQLPDLNGSQPSEVVEQIPSGVPETRREESVSLKTSIVDQTPFTTISNVNNVSVITLQIPQRLNNGACSTNDNLNADFTARGMEPGALHTRIISFAQLSCPTGLSPAAGNSERKERKRKQMMQQAASVIPDLNGNVSDACASGKTMPEGNPITPESVPSQKRRRTNEEDPGASLTLKFALGSNLPSKETLVAKFSRYGLLKDSEMQFLDDSSVQIAYARTSDARFAFRSMEKSKPFGEELASFKLDCALSPPTIKPKRNNQRTQRPSHPVVDMPRNPATARPGETPNIAMMRQNAVDTPRNPATARPGETPDIAMMRQNVEMMKMTLEKDGSNLAPEIRVKLEHEINVFLDKINTLGFSSSTP